MIGNIQKVGLTLVPRSTSGIPTRVTAQPHLLYQSLPPDTQQLDSLSTATSKGGANDAVIELARTLDRVTLDQALSLSEGRSYSLVNTWEMMCEMRVPVARSKISTLKTPAIRGVFDLLYRCRCFDTAGGIRAVPFHKLYSRRHASHVCVRAA